MAGVFDFLHIKGRTAGSSNELSFDVLEQKSVEADERANRPSKLPKAPKASQGSYAGVAGTSTLSGQAEVERRKKARQAQRLRFQVFAVLVVVILIGVGVYAGMRYHNSQMDIASRVNALVDRLAAEDETLVVVDGLMIDPFDAENANRRSAAIGASPKVMSELNRISDDAQTLSEYPIDDETAVVVGQIDKAAQARVSMLSVSTEAFRLSSESSEQVDRANRVWSDVLDADQLAREAMSAANKATTPEATQQALESIRSAISGFEETSAELADMSATYGVDFTAQMAYLSKKVEALEKAVETSEALLAGDRDAAMAANEAYAEADAEAVALASNLPPAIGDIVQAQFQRKMTDCLKRYEEARNRTVEADSIIRDYLS